MSEAVREPKETHIGEGDIGVLGREFDWELAHDMGMKMLLPGDEGWKAPEPAMAGKAEQ